MYLIGVVHADIKGTERLAKLLKYLNPRSVSLEWSVASGSLIPEYNELIEDVGRLNDFAERDKNKLLSLNLPKSFKEYLIKVINAYGYELKVVVDLKDMLGYQIYCVDYPELRERRLMQISKVEDIPKIFTSEQLEILKGLSTQQLFQHNNFWIIGKKFVTSLILTHPLILRYLKV